MKECPICAAQLDEAYGFCPEDGSILQSQHADIGDGVQTINDPDFEGSVSTSDQAAESSEPEHLPREADVVPEVNEPKLILHCPVCSSEFPPTFDRCPTHGVDLVNVTQPDSEATPIVDQGPVEVDEPLEEPVEVARADEVASAARTGTSGESEFRLKTLELEPAQEKKEPKDSFLAFTEPSQSSFSITAAVVAVLLILIAVIGVASVATTLRKRPATQPPTKSAGSNYNVAAEIAVETPTAALDYKEEPKIVEQPTSVADSTTASSERGPSAKQPATQDREPARIDYRRSDEGRQPKDSQQAQSYTATPQKVRQVTTPRESVDQPIRSTYNTLSSHLVHVQSSRTSAGFHYELTFSLANESGQQSFLRNLTIVTRSSYGTTKSQTLPFTHRLGPNGSLTFKLGVDLPGRSPGDWSGHVSLVAAGYDSVGGLMQTRFAAPLSP